MVFFAMALFFKIAQNPFILEDYPSANQSRPIHIYTYIHKNICIVYINLTIIVYI